MTTKLIEIEADALEEARQQAKSQIPKGLSMLSEEVISDGKPKVLKSIAETKEIAYAKAQNEVPKDASILEKKELVAPEQKIVIVEAFDEQSARIQAGNQSGNTAIIKSIKTVTLGSKGFLGIGKKPNQYQVEVFQQAIVEITYKTMARIIVKIGKIIADQNVPPTAEGIWTACPRKMKYGLDPVLVCEMDYCCVDMVVSHHWKGAIAHAPRCDNQEMIDFISGLQRNQLYLLRYVNLDEILRR